MSSYLIPFIQTGFANSSGNSNIANTANYANFAGTVTNSNQPNITSVGNLTSLVVSGNLSANNHSVSNISNVNQLNANGNVTFSGSNVSLGTVANVHIGGGTSGYVLQTDGTGNLSWVAQAGGNGSGNGSVAGSNTEVQYNNAGNFGASAGFTFNSASNTFNVPANITSTQNGGNLYLTGWSNIQNLSNPSLFMGIYKRSYGTTSNYIPSGSATGGNIRIDNGLLSNSIILGNTSNNSPLGNVVGFQQGGFSIINDNIYLSNLTTGISYKRNINDYNANWTTIFSPNLSNLPATSGQRFFSNITYVQGNYYILGASISKTVFPNPDTSNFKVILYKSSNANTTGSWTEHYTYSVNDTSPFIYQITDLGITASANNVIIYHQLTETFTPTVSNSFNTLYRSFTSNAANANSFSTYSVIATGGNLSANSIMYITPIVYNNNYFLLGTANITNGNSISNIVTSTDGNIWSNVTGPTNNANTTSTRYVDLTVQNNNYVLLGYSSSNTTPYAFFSANSTDGNIWTTSNIGNLVPNIPSRIYALNNTSNTLILNAITTANINQCYFSTNLGNTWTFMNTIPNLALNGFSPVYESNRQAITFYGGNSSNGMAQIQIPAINVLDTSSNIYNSAGSGYYQFLGGDNNGYGLFVKTGNV